MFICTLRLPRLEASSVLWGRLAGRLSKAEDPGLLHRYHLLLAYKEALFNHLDLRVSL